DSDLFAGSLVAGDGVGASLGVVPVTKRTSATIGQRAKVDALGKGNATPAFTGERNSSGFVTQDERGVAVQAYSTEDFLTFTVAGARFGRSAGLAGAVSVAVVDSDTSASIGELALINTDRANAGINQGVSVAAVNRVENVGIDGTLSVNQSAALAGAVDVGL